jgi:two-component system LytT family response regulator
MIRALIVDDELQARDFIRFCAGLEPDLEIVGEAANARDAAALIDELSPDVVFLDVRMPGMNGIHLAASLEGRDRPVIVFVTAHDEYALRAFELHAAAYLLKPFDDERFASAMRHVTRLLDGPALERLQDVSELLSRLAGGAGSAPAPVSRLVVRSGGRVTIVDLSDIDWIEAAGNYVKLHTGGTAHMLGRTMTEMEATLPPDRFVRIHRSAIVNLDRVKELRTQDNRDFMVVLHGGGVLRLSRTYRDAFERALGSKL